jgi:hypothetical protein
MDSQKIEKIAEDAVVAVVQEVTQKECVCGKWSLRISLTPKTPPPAISEVLPKGVSMSPALGTPESA